MRKREEGREAGVDIEVNVSSQTARGNTKFFASWAPASSA